MLIDVFKPAHLQTIAISVTGSSQLVLIPGSGTTIEVCNPSSSVTVFVETCPAAGTIIPDPSTAIVPIVGTAGSYPILPGQSKKITRHIANNETYLSVIGSAAGPTVIYVTPGLGS